MNISIRQEKRCSRCGAWKSIDKFYRDPTRKDRRRPQCKECQSAYNRSPAGRERSRRYNRSKKGKRRSRRYEQSEKGRERHRRYEQSEGRKESFRRRREWHPERIRARNAINNAIVAGNFPPASVHQCADCGGAAEQYHHLSYREEHWFDVLPLCGQCHHIRHIDGFPSRETQESAEQTQGNNILSLEERR